MKMLEIRRRPWWKFAALPVLMGLLASGYLTGFAATTPVEPIPIPPGQLRQAYIVARLDSVTVHDDEDPFGPGEIMVFAGGGSGSLTQTTSFPIQLGTSNFKCCWREANSGNTFPVNAPLLVIPESQMGNHLVLTVAVIDNDEIPTWFARALPKIGAAFGRFILGELGRYAAGDPGGAVGEQFGGTAGTELGKALADYMGENEIIGTFEGVHSRNFDGWGIPATTSSSDDVQPLFPCGTFKQRAGNMTVTYSVCRIAAFASKTVIGPTIPSIRTFVHLETLTIHENGDGAKGEVIALTKTTDGVSAPFVRRFPAEGHTSLSDGARWDIGQLIYEGKSASPVLQVEVDAWDLDAPNAGDDHDMLGIAPWLFVMSSALPLPTNVGETSVLRHEWRVKGIGEGDVTVHIRMTLKRE